MNLTFFILSVGYDTYIQSLKYSRKSPTLSRYIIAYLEYLVSFEKKVQVFIN
jgi:hypothetical protein